MFKLLFIDIDGTLLTSDHQISPNTRAAIERIISVNKLTVILTTARPPQAVKNIYNSLNLSSPVICYNGALILKDLNLRNNVSELLSIGIAPKFLTQVYTAAAEYKLNISFYIYNKWMTHSYDDWIKQEESITGTKADIIDIPNQIEKCCNENYGPHKILLMGEATVLDSIINILKDKTNYQLSIYKSKPTYLEIMDIASTKHSAIEFLLKQFNVSGKEIIAIGDNYNDLEMLQMAGLGIAMGNAPEDVKAQADYITLDNDSDGISFALEQFIP